MTEKRTQSSDTIPIPIEVVRKRLMESGYPPGDEDLAAALPAVPLAAPLPREEP